MDKKSRELVMAKLYFKNKDYKMAEKSFNEYLSMNPEDVSALKLLAQVYEHNKKFDKAFDVYERCYLAEPERTGTLLDICRILLMNEIWLEHVDYRKWLNLAIKAFPSNPIVVNFKAFLSTLPSDEQSSPQHVPQRLQSKGEDPIFKVLEKLSLIEKRLDDIEDKISKIKISDTVPAKNTKNQEAHANDKEVVPKEVPVSSPQPKSNNSATVKPAEKPVEKPVEKPAVASFDSPFSKFNISGTAPASGNLFADSIKKFNVTTENTWGSANTSLFSFSNLPKIGQNDKTPTLTTNFFSKLETTPEKQEADDDDNEVVPNEELAIENTCDMEPIEIKTGEEEEDLLFEHRCKLFRFRDKEYKERGIGSIKVLKHKSTGKGRLIMRRDVIGLVCLNCWDCSKIERVKDTQVRWRGLDASDEQPEATVFLVRFKTEELTDKFMSHMTAVFPEDSSPKAPASSPQPKLNASSPQPQPAASSPQQKPTNLATEKTDIAAINPPFSKINISDTAPASSNLFADSIKKFNIPTENAWGSANTSLFSFTNLPKMEQSDNAATVTTNLFADSLKKFNISQSPSSMFSFSKPVNTPEKQEADDDDNEVVPNEELAIENTCDMEPIEIKTGEEEEDLLFEHRCKLFRFRDKEYKERGIGSIKVLKHKSTGKGRLIMRRDVIGLVCLNCWDCSKIERVKDTQVRWRGLDASDGQPEAAVLLVRFKTEELTDKFMSHLTAVFPDDSSPNTAASSLHQKSTNSANEKPDIELIDPKLDQSLVDKARRLQLPDLFYHTLKNQEPCSGCNGCENED